jgi:3-deoxy-D-manno-octulosonic-acid transferase
MTPAGARRLYTLGWYAALPWVAAYLLSRSLRQPQYRLNWRERFFGLGPQPASLTPGPSSGLRPEEAEKDSEGAGPAPSRSPSRADKSGRGDELRPMPASSRSHGPAEHEGASPAPSCSSSASSGHRPEEELRIWLHAVSVGETRAAQPLIERLAARYPRAQFVLTHMTPTGRGAAQPVLQALAGRITQRYLPYDLPPSMRRFLSQVRPSILILLETEIWPNLQFEARRAGVPVILVNARLSERSLARALRWPSLMIPAAGALSAVAAQTDADRARWAKLYQGPIQVTGNLKFDLAPSAGQMEAGRAVRRRLGDQGVWMFASTREGEERAIVDALVCAAHRAAGDRALLFVPRHPQRFEEVARLLSALGAPVVRRARFDSMPADSRVLLGDSMGEMPMYYAMADVALVGGSLAPLGGQNLIEACACGCPVLFGPHMFNFAQAARDALACGAALQVSDAAAAIKTMSELQADPPRREKMAQAALAFAQAHRGATERTVELIDGLLVSARTVGQSCL